MALAMVLASGMASAITYGQPDGNRHPYVGTLVGADDVNGEFGYCTGTLIAPDVFLTAAHCTAEQPEDEEFGFEFRGVTFDNVYDPGTSRVYPGTLHTHPGWPGTSSVSGVGPDFHDIAVVVLDEEVAGIQPASLPSAGLLDQLANDGELQDQRFTVVGYGTTDAPTSPEAELRSSTGTGRGGTRSRALAPSIRPSYASRRTRPPAMAAPASATRAVPTSWAPTPRRRTSPCRSARQRGTYDAEP